MFLIKNFGWCGLSGINKQINFKGGVDYPGQTTKIQKKSLDGGVDYPGQTTNIEKKFRWRCELSGKTYQSIIISIFLNMFLSIIDKHFLIYLI